MTAKRLMSALAGYGYHVANHYIQWMEWAGVSATTTYNELSFKGGKDWQLSSTRPHKEELNMDDMAKVGHSPDAKDTDHTGAHYNLNKTGNYVLEEAEPVGTDLIMKMKGWIYIKEDGQYNIAAKHFQDMVDVKIADESFGKWAYWFGSGDNGPHGGNHIYNLKKGFYRIEVDYVDRTEDTFLDIMIKKRSQNASDYKIIGSKDSGTHLFSDSYVKALHDKGYVSDEKDGLIAGKKAYRSLINQEKDTSKPAKYFGDDADDFNKVIHLKHNTDALEGSNLNDVFIYNGKNIDAKGGVDKLIFVEDTKLEKVSNLNDNLKSFERLQLGTENQAVSISFNTKNVLDIIDSRTTRITEGEYSTLTTVSGTESINTVLKILGDSNDIVKLINDGTNKFELATNEEVTLLNWKHSKAIGGSYNKVETDGNGHVREFQPDPTHNPDVWETYKDASGKPIIDSYDTPVNHVYKGTYTDGTSTKTFFVEIDKNSKITHEGDDQNNTFTYEGNKIDAKGGVDTLIFTENIDLSRVDDLNDKLKSFETLQLGSNSAQAVSIGLDAKSVLDIIDSQITDGGLKSVNTVLKIKGDSNDKVALDGKGTIFTQATDSEVAALNLKHSALGDTHNQVAVDGSGHAVNQVYKGIYGSGASAQTFFVEIDKDVSVVNLVH